MKKNIIFIMIVAIIIAIVMMTPGNKMTYNHFSDSEVRKIINDTYKEYHGAEIYETQNVYTRQYFSDDINTLSELIGIQVNKIIVNEDRIDKLVSIEEMRYYLKDDENKFSFDSYYILDLENNFYYDAIVEWYPIQAPLTVEEKEIFSWIQYKDEDFPYYFNFFDSFDISDISTINFLDEEEILDIHSLKKIKADNYLVTSSNNNEYIISIDHIKEEIVKIKYENDYLYNDDYQDEYELKKSDRVYLENLGYDFDNNITKIKLSYEVFLNKKPDTKISIPDFEKVREYFMIGEFPGKVDHSPNNKLTIYVDNTEFEQICNAILYDKILDKNTYITNYDFSDEYVDGNLTRVKEVKWLNNEEILILEGPTYGTTIAFTKLYKYNIYTKSKELIENTEEGIWTYKIHNVLDDNGNFMYDDDGNRLLILEQISYKDDTFSDRIYSTKQFN